MNQVIKADTLHTEWAELVKLDLTMLGNTVGCSSQQEANEVVAMCEAEGFKATVTYWGSCDWEVRYWKELEVA